MPHLSGLLHGDLHRCCRSPKLVGAVEGIGGGRGHHHGKVLTARLVRRISDSSPLSLSKSNRVDRLG